MNESHLFLTKFLKMVVIVRYLKSHSPQNAILVRRPARPPLGRPPCEVLRPKRPEFNSPVLPRESLPFRSRARRNNSDVLGLRLSLDTIDAVDGCLSIMSDVDDRRILGGISIERNGELVCERE